MRHERQVAFFDHERRDESIHFIDLSEEAMCCNLEGVLQRVAAATDAIIVQRHVEVDSRVDARDAVVKVRASAHSGDLGETRTGPTGV